MGIKNFLKKFKFNESGETLPGLLVNSAISGFVLIAAGSFIFSALSANNDVTSNTAMSATVSLMDASFGTDVGNSTLIKANTATAMELTLPGRTTNMGGTFTATCRTVIWEIKTVSTVTSITRSLITYPTQSLNASGIIVCSGVASPVVTITVAGTVDAGTRFSYANGVGHTINVSTSTTTTTRVFSADAAPAGVPVAVWNEPVIARATLTTIVTVAGETQAVTSSKYSAGAKNSKQPF